ncbi:MAG: hypothetical protein WC523_05895 [Patescibacteria group bacterium]|jgi:dihydroorotase
MKIAINILKPFDAHVHLRQGTILRDVIPFTADIFEAAVAMGNLAEPVDNLSRLLAYRQEILKAAEIYPEFNPIMTIMLTPHTTVETIKVCAPYAKVLKFIPANTSTNAQAGVSLENLSEYYPVLEEVKKQGLIFSIHAERIQDDGGKTIAEADRELAALPFVKKIIRDFPNMKIIVEHLSTKEACDLVLSSPENVAGTITAHHALFSESFLRARFNNLKPEFYCKPVLKSIGHQTTIKLAMLSGSAKLFFGSDSAPHPAAKKFANPPAAGIFSAPVAIPLIAEVFARYGKLNLLENFLSISGRMFYGLPIPNKEIVIYYDRRSTNRVPEVIGEDKIPVLLGGEELFWKTAINHYK